MDGAFVVVGAVVIDVAAGFVFDDAEEMRAAYADEIERPIYSRFTNPNVSELVDRLCVMEGAEAGHATASGMAAVFATFAALCGAGDHILSGRDVFGATHTLLTKMPQFTKKISMTTSGQANTNHTNSTFLITRKKTLFIYFKDISATIMTNSLSLTSVEIVYRVRASTA